VSKAKTKPRARRPDDQIGVFFKTRAATKWRWDEELKKQYPDLEWTEFVNELINRALCPELCKARSLDRATESAAKRESET
jgi:hypothetical protein